MDKLEAILKRSTVLDPRLAIELAGADACRKQARLSENPYKSGSFNAAVWSSGWADAAQDFICAFEARVPRP